MNRHSIEHALPEIWIGTRTELLRTGAAVLEG
jgi:hypothetical protein